MKSEDKIKKLKEFTERAAAGALVAAAAIPVVAYLGAMTVLATVLSEVVDAGNNLYDWIQARKDEGKGQK